MDEQNKTLRLLTRWVLVGISIAVLVGIAWTADGWLLRPAQADPTTVTDAIFVNGGGDGERLDRGLELIDAGVADHLVLSPAYRNGVPPTESEWEGQMAVVATCDQGLPERHRRVSPHRGVLDPG